METEKQLSEKEANLKIQEEELAVRENMLCEQLKKLGDGQSESLENFMERRNKMTAAIGSINEHTRNEN